MKLLIVTQKVDMNDSVLGFFHRWIELLSRQSEKVTVICLEEGAHLLPENVEVLSLGKEENVSRLQYLYRFYKYIIGWRKQYDNVFVHMNPEYVVLGGIVWKLLKKKVGLWYVHKSVNLKLKIAGVLADRVFTTTYDACRIAKKKVCTIGHGIDMEIFSSGLFVPNNTIAHIGRIAPIKHIDMIACAAEKNSMELHLYGEAKSDDSEYKKQISDMFPTVILHGRIPFKDLPEVYSKHQCTVNAAPTGGMDKAVIESWACGVPAFVRNEAFRMLLGADSDTFMFTNVSELSEKIKAFFQRDNTEEIVIRIRDRVRDEYDLHVLIERIVTDSVYVRD